MSSRKSSRFQQTGDAHVIVIDGVSQSVTEHCVDELNVTKLHSIPHVHAMSGLQHRPTRVNQTINQTVN